MGTTLEIVRYDDETPLGGIRESTCVPRVGEYIWLMAEGKEQTSWKVVEVAYWAYDDFRGGPGLSRAMLFVEPVVNAEDGS